MILNYHVLIIGTSAFALDQIYETQEVYPQCLPF